MAAKPSQEDLERFRNAVAAPKIWVAGNEIGWVLNGSGPPPGHKFRAPLAFKIEPNVQPLDLFLAGYFKDSTFPGVPPKISVGLFFSGHRVVGIDDDGPGCHYNSVGEGMPHYLKEVGFPHLHRIVDDAIYGYAEPLESVSTEELWTTFLGLANIEEAPLFQHPAGQLEMKL